MNLNYNLLFSIIFRQEAFMENYFASQRDNIFRNVEVLIYVFDVESRELGKSLAAPALHGSLSNYEDDSVQ